MNISWAELKFPPINLWNVWPTEEHCNIHASFQDPRLWEPEVLEFILKDGGKLPIKGSKQAAGFDLATNEKFTIGGNSSCLVSTGVYLADCPMECYLRIASRSKIAAKLHIDVAAGVVDSDYRGEIKVLLRNTSACSITFEAGEKIAQLIPEVICNVDAIQVNWGTDTERGSAGISDNDTRL